MMNNRLINLISYVCLVIGFLILIIGIDNKIKSDHIALKSSIDSLVVSNKRLEKKMNVIYPYFVGAY